jgi:hypothetical protein
MLMLVRDSSASSELSLEYYTDSRTNKNLTLSPVGSALRHWNENRPITNSRPCAGIVPTKQGRSLIASKFSSGCGVTLPNTLPSFLLRRLLLLYLITDRMAKQYPNSPFG